MRAALIFIAGCTGASVDPGYGNALAIDDAQFRPGAFPAATGGPVVASAVSGHQSVAIGTFREELHAIMAPDARAAIVGIAALPVGYIRPRQRGRADSARRTSSVISHRRLRGCRGSCRDRH